MDFILIDTDVLSYLFKDDTRGDLYQDHLDGPLGFVSFMTIAELDYWAVSHNWGQRKKKALEEFLSPYSILEPDRALCRKWAEVRDQVTRDGSYLETADLWIAATALLYDVPLVTHNRHHFSRVKGLTIISEAPA